MQKFSQHLLCIRKIIFTFVKVKKIARFGPENAENGEKSECDGFQIPRFSHRKRKVYPPQLKRISLRNF